LALWIPTTYESAVIGFAVMYGFVSGAFIGLFAALPASVSPMPETGYRMGVVMLFISIPALTMGLIGGQILQNSADGWLHMKIFGGVMCLAGPAIILCARVLFTRSFGWYFEVR
jgi:MFS transporter, MCT family, aspergillic acid transporter